MLFRIGVLFFGSLGLAAICAAIFSFRRRGSAALRAVPGSRIALRISGRFGLSDRFSGFVDEASAASIMVMDLPQPAFDQLQDLSYLGKMLSEQGVHRAKRRRLRGRRGEYIYFRGEQETALVDYVKYILFFRGAGAAGMVTANIPRAALLSGLVTEGEVESILGSAAMLVEAAG